MTHSPLPWMLHHKPNGLCAITSGRDILVADDVRPADAELVLARMKRADELEAENERLRAALQEIRDLPDARADECCTVADQALKSARN